MMIVEWEHILLISFPINENIGSLRLEVCSSIKSTTVPFSAQGINYLNQLLEEIHDWVNKTKWVVDSFMGSPIDICLNTIGLKV